MMPRFNIAAVPVDVQTSERFYHDAAAFNKIADGYLLETGRALPHMTLCQFRAKNSAHALRLSSSFLGKDISVSIDGFKIDPVSNPPDGKNGTYWAAYSVKRSDRLIALQAEIVETIQREGLEFFTKKLNWYFPHFTLARLSMMPSFINETHPVFDGCLDRADVGCRVRLGLSDEIGQFLSFADEGT